MEINLKHLIYNHRSLTNIKEHPHFSMKHSHNNYEIIFFERGKANYVIEGKRYELKSNDLIFTRPLAYHYIEIQSHTEYVRYNIAFDASIIGKNILGNISPDIEIINCSNQNIITENFRRLDYYGNYLDETVFIEVLTGLLKEILVNVSLSAQDVVCTPSEISPIITRALAYINRNLFELKSIKEVCNYLCLSEPYFFKLFKAQLKIPPKQYVNLKRIQSAQKMIQRGQKPSKVYSECGFDSYVGFYKQYIKIFGYSPSGEKP